MGSALCRSRSISHIADDRLDPDQTRLGLRNISTHYRNILAHIGNISTHYRDIAAEPFFHRLKTSIHSGGDILNPADDHCGRGQHAGHNRDEVTHMRKPSLGRSGHFTCLIRCPAFLAVYDAAEPSHRSYLAVASWLRTLSTCPLRMSCCSVSLMM